MDCISDLQDVLVGDIIKRTEMMETGEANPGTQRLFQHAASREKKVLPSKSSEIPLLEVCNRLFMF